MIDLSGETIFLLAPKKPASLDEVRALFSAGELQMLEIEETSKAYAIKLKGYLGRKAFAANQTLSSLQVDITSALERRASSSYRKNRSQSSSGS